MFGDSTNVKGRLIGQTEIVGKPRTHDYFRRVLFMSFVLCGVGIGTEWTSPHLTVSPGVVR